MSFFTELIKGLWKDNPIFRLVLGMCPTLAVTTSLENAIGMGVAATFVLIGSNVVVSMVRNFIPAKVRIPCYILIIASFVTIIELLMKANTPELYNSLGLFIPLIVVNCIILGRAEAFASKNTVLMSIADGIGMGLGFTLGLSIIGVFREVLGNGTITVWGSLGWKIYHADPILLMVLAPGGFLSLGLILGFLNSIQAKVANMKGKTFTPPAHLDCRSCTLCNREKV